MAFRISLRKARSRRLFKSVLLACAAVGVLAVGFFITRIGLPFLASQYTVESSYTLAAETQAALPQKTIVRPSLPVRLTIPAIKVDATILHVGVASDGSMETTKDPDRLGWYELGQRPGEIGSAVIAGHYGWRDGIPAVFDHLDDLRVGDKVYSEDEKKLVTIFVVRDVRTYNQNDDAQDVFHSADNKAHLNLITCEGTWDASSKSYPKRLVVFTDKE